MKDHHPQPLFGPDEWDIDFTFDLNLSFLDYLLISLYLVFLTPLLLLLDLIWFLIRKVKGGFKNKQEPQQKPAPAHGYFSIISKLF